MDSYKLLYKYKGVVTLWLEEMLVTHTTYPSEWEVRYMAVGHL